VLTEDENGYQRRVGVGGARRRIGLGGDLRAARRGSGPRAGHGGASRPKRWRRLSPDLINFMMAGDREERGDLGEN
jgi:hypothetical protein